MLWKACPRGRVLLDPHSDQGLLTVAPLSDTSGLQVLSLVPQQGQQGQQGQQQGPPQQQRAAWRWTDVEPRAAAGQVIIFGGELLGWLSRGEVRPLLHRVAAANQERAGEPQHRLSIPFFQRPPASGALALADDGGREVVVATRGSTERLSYRHFKAVRNGFAVYRSSHVQLACEGDAVDDCAVTSAADAPPSELRQCKLPVEPSAAAELPYLVV